MSTLYKYVTGGREVTFLDGEDAYDPETIRKHWQSSFPELGNCQAETNKAKKDEKLKVNAEVDGVAQEVEVDAVVSFVKKVGTKGTPDAAPGHTPGPWRVKGAMVYAGKIGVAWVDPTNRPANARLMAAAPRMLEAWRAVVKWANARCMCPFCDAYAGFDADILPIDEQGNAVGHDSDCPWPFIRRAVAEATGELLAEPGEGSDGHHS